MNGERHPLMQKEGREVAVNGRAETGVSTGSANKEEIYKSRFATVYGVAGTCHCSKTQTQPFLALLSDGHHAGTTGCYGTRALRDFIMSCDEFSYSMRRRCHRSTKQTQRLFTITAAVRHAGKLNCTGTVYWYRCDQVCYRRRRYEDCQS